MGRCVSDASTAAAKPNDRLRTGVSARRLSEPNVVALGSLVLLTKLEARRADKATGAGGAWRWVTLNTQGTWPWTCLPA